MPAIPDLLVVDVMHQLMGRRVIRRHRWPIGIIRVVISTATVDIDAEFVQLPTQVARLFFDQLSGFPVSLFSVIGSVASRYQHKTKADSNRKGRL
ncbi:MAG: hypothetical protein CMJ78_27485 [Planctomycetaceae bacterium]|nr:hypothetical protein [Planctomycetaceae bacterium]